MEIRGKLSSLKSFVTDIVWPVIRLLLGITITVGALIVGALLPLAGAVFGDYSDFGIVFASVFLALACGLVFFMLSSLDSCRKGMFFGLWLFISGLISMILAMSGSVVSPRDLAYMQNEQQLVLGKNETRESIIFLPWDNVIISRNVRGTLTGREYILEAPDQLVRLDMVLTYNVTTAAGDLAAGNARNYLPAVESAFKVAIAKTRRPDASDAVALAAYRDALKANTCTAVTSANKLFSCPLELQVNFAVSSRTLNINAS